MNKQKLSPIWQLRIKDYLKTSLFKVTICISICSVILILSPLFFGKTLELDVILQNIGFNLLGAVCAFIAFQVVFQQLKNKEEEQGIQLTMLDKREFIKNISSNRSQVEIMETWTNLLRERDYKEDFKTAIIKSINENKVECKFLLLNPENNTNVQKRENQLREYDPNIDIERNIYQNLLELQKLKNILGKNQDKLSVKLYNTEPSLAIYKCQPNMILTFYKDKMSSEEGRLGDLVKYATNSITGNFFTNRFLQIWDEPTTISLDEILYLTVDIKGEEKSFDYVKYILLDEKYYIENTKLAEAITNTKKKLIVNKKSKKTYIFTTLIIDDLTDDAKERFENKYPKIGNIFFRLEELNEEK